MFRIGRNGITVALAAFLALAMVLVSVTAEAGQLRRKYKGSHSGSVASSVGPYVSGHRTRSHHAGKGRFEAHKRWNKGGWNTAWKKAGSNSGYAGNRRIWSEASRKYGIDRPRHADDGYPGIGSVSVVVGEDYSAAPGNSAAILVDGPCAAGQYCTIRLGPWSNSPKIITLGPAAEPLK